MVTCTNDDGTLSTNVEGARYLVGPDEIEAKQTFKVGRKKVRPKLDVETLLRHFKATGDAGRLVAAEIEVPAD